MVLGVFSVSLAVKDLDVSKSIYEKRGFHDFSGDTAQNWLVMKNGEYRVGLVQGMFENSLAPILQPILSFHYPEVEMYS